MGNDLKDRFSDSDYIRSIAKEIDKGTYSKWVDKNTNGRTYSNFVNENTKIESYSAALDQLIKNDKYKDLSKDKVEKVKGLIIVNIANAMIEKQVVAAMAKCKGKNAKYTQSVINKLIESTEKISKDTISKATKYGIVAVCEYETYIIGGIAVPIDPIRVIRA
ncbi:hypothetical protein SDC9_175852 [bioreactor metagenome]|uniref:Uncharacterized protein n=1 Tax=bioreactor metagenome TaxID=1076179 RepID=A0A645GNA0_9ZZZZ